MTSRGGRVINHKQRLWTHHSRAWLDRMTPRQSPEMSDPSSDSGGRGDWKVGTAVKPDRDAPVGRGVASATRRIRATSEAAYPTLLPPGPKPTTNARPNHRGDWRRRSKRRK